MHRMLTTIRRAACVLASLLVSAQLLPSAALACEGGGAEPLLVSENPVAFGLVTLGTTPEKTITFTADEAVKIEKTITAPRAPFGVGKTNTCNGVLLAAKATCQYSITFSPASMNKETALLTFEFEREANHELRPVSVLLEGKGD